MPSAHDLRIHEPTLVSPRQRAHVHAELAASLVALVEAAGGDPAAVDPGHLEQFYAWAVESLPTDVVERIRAAEGAPVWREEAA